MRALYDFTPQNAGEVQLETGQVYIHNKSIIMLYNYDPSLLGPALLASIIIMLYIDCSDDS